MATDEQIIETMFGILRGHLSGYGETPTEEQVVAHLRRVYPNTDGWIDRVQELVLGPADW